MKCKIKSILAILILGLFLVFLSGCLKVVEETSGASDDSASAEEAEINDALDELNEFDNLLEDDDFDLDELENYDYN